MAIANSKKGDGSWDWKTFITGEYIIADLINAERMRTNNVEIGDDDGRVLIGQDGVTIKDRKQTTLENYFNAYWCSWRAGANYHAHTNLFLGD